MTQLYTIRTTPTPGEWNVKKFDRDFNCVAEYLVTRDTCSGPDGHRPKCKHREMLGMALKARQVDTGGFLDWDTRMWHAPLVNPGPMADDLMMDNTILSEPPMLGLSEAERMAQALAPAHESEASALVRVSDAGMIRDTMEAQSALTAAAPPPAAVNPPPAKAEVQRANAGGGNPPIRLMRIKI